MNFNFSILKFYANFKKNINFLGSFFGIFFNPFFIIRRALYVNIKRISPLLTGKLLDFGCGSKPYKSLFYNAKDYVGIDNYSSSHDHKNSEIDFSYDGKKLPFKNDEFDSVFSSEVFEHIFNIDEILIELNRVLKINGKLLITIPFAWEEHEQPFDFARYTSYGIKFLLEKYKFNILENTKTTTTFLAIAQVFIAYLSQHVLPRNIYFYKIFHILIITPLSVLALTINFFLPKRYEYYCNCILLVEKKENLNINYIK
jgi:SAM-dependent methyltransferase